MVCYQVLARFVFHQGRPALVSTHIKKQNAKAFLVLSGISFGSASLLGAFSTPEKKRLGMPLIFMRSIRAVLFQIRRFPAASFICFRGVQMRTEKTINIQGLIAYVKKNSEWQIDTIHHVVTALGYRSTGSLESLKNLFANLADCAKHGADSGFPGFTYYSDTLAFFRRNREDIVKNIELLAKELGEDIIGMVQGFGVFRYDTPPTPVSIVRALWGTGKLKDDLTSLYNVFAWCCLKEVSHVWYRYLEDNPDYYAELSA
jgi:hypothetical protein